MVNGKHEGCTRKRCGFWRKMCIFLQTGGLRPQKGRYAPRPRRPPDPRGVGLGGEAAAALIYHIPMHIGMNFDRRSLGVAPKAPPDPNWGGTPGGRGWGGKALITPQKEGGIGSAVYLPRCKGTGCALGGK